MFRSLKSLGREITITRRARLIDLVTPVAEATVALLFSRSEPTHGNDARGLEGREEAV